MTIKEIAERLNLSAAAVSRALRNDETLSIAPETRQKILMAAEEMGYTRPEKSMTKDYREKSVVVVHRNQTFRNQIDSSYYFAIRSGIEDVCAQKRIKPFFVPIEEIKNFDLKADGVLMIGNFTHQQYEELFPLIKNLPVTVIGIVAHYRDRVDHVTYNNYETVSLGLRYLLEQGHTKIGYLGVCEAEGTELFGTRIDAFKHILNSKGLLSEDWIFECERGEDRVEQSYILVKKILSEAKPLPTAFFCANDPVALGASNALQEEGFSVPDDISLLSHDGTFPTQYSFPSLTTVDVHPYQLGMEGICMLLERIVRPTKYTKRLLLSPSLIERNSVKKLKKRRK